MSDVTILQFKISKLGSSLNINNIGLKKFYSSDKHYLIKSVTALPIK